MHPSWSPDSSRIAFVSDRAEAMNVWVVPMSGGRPAGTATRLTSGRGVEYAPWWSPDGRSIAFTRYEGDTIGIWTVFADGSAPPRRLAGAPRAFMVRWIEAGLFSAGNWDAAGLSLRRIDPVSGRVSPLDPPLALGSTVFDISRDGALVAYDQRPERGDIWVLDREPFSGR
jgi:dipeptidyl aminopeptidase/acylaminoacyl peptidase